MARAFVEREKPRSPVLIAYGETFPDFIAARFPGLGPPYLVDLARLENAWVDAYHAEDAPTVGLADLADARPGDSARTPRSRSIRRRVFFACDARRLDLGVLSG